MSKIEVEKNLELRRRALDKDPGTGYPHLDKRHLQFYKEDALIYGDIPNLSMFGLLFNNCWEYWDSAALEYFGREITYRELIDKIKEYVTVFLNDGITAGDVVSIAAPNLPEVIYSVYALNKIGAVVNLIDPRNNLERIKQYINQVESKKLIMYDGAYPKIKKLLDETKIDKVYTISAADSLPFGLNFAQRAKMVVENAQKKLPNCPENDMYQSLRKRASQMKKLRVPVIYPDIDYNTIKDEVAIIINTSGTTGTPKGVMLTNENLNAVAIDYKYSGLEYEIGDSFLGIMPNFLAYGIGVGLHMNFCLGLKHIIVPSSTPEDFPALIKKHKPAHFAGVPSHYQHLMTDKQMKNFDLSFVKTAAAGGDTFNPSLKKEVNEFLENHGSFGKIKVGYGCTENTGLASSQFYVGESLAENELTTVGIPALHTNFRIVSRETGEDLGYNTPGEILLTGKGVMKGYVNNEEETNKVIEEINGERYLHTGDVGYIDDSGCIYIVDRIKRIIVRPDGHNVFPSYIEKVVASHPFVKECACVGVKDAQNINGRAPVAFIVIEEGHESEVGKIIAELETMSLNALPERDVALDYVVIENIPMTPAGKVDFVQLEGSYVYNPVKRSRIFKK